MVTDDDDCDNPHDDQYADDNDINSNHHNCYLYDCDNYDNFLWNTELQLHMASPIITAFYDFLIAAYHNSNDK